MEDVSVLDIASAFGYSEAYFCKLFKQNFGKNFVTYLTEYRVELAKTALADLSCNVKEVGQRVGYTVLPSPPVAADEADRPSPDRHSASPNQSRETAPSHHTASEDNRAHALKSPSAHSQTR